MKCCNAVVIIGDCGCISLREHLRLTGIIIKTMETGEWIHYSDAPQVSSKREFGKSTIPAVKANPHPKYKAR